MTPTNQEDREFLCRLRDEHPQCRTEVSSIMEAIHEIKEDVHALETQFNERMPSRHPWAGWLITAVISILSTAAIMYTGIFLGALMPINGRVTALETNMGTAIPKANTARIDALETNFKDIREALWRIEVKMAEEEKVSP